MSSNTLSLIPFFSPTQISNCSLWLDGADSTTISLSGSNITQWRDKSSNGLVLSQGTASNQPTLGPLLNSLQTIQFTTTQSLSSTANLLTNPAQSWFTVFNAYNNTNTNRFFFRHSGDITVTGGEYFFGGNGTMWANRKSGNLSQERAFIDTVGLGTTPFSSAQWYNTNVVDSNTTTNINSFSFRIDGTSRSISIYSTSSNILSGTANINLYINPGPAANVYISEIIFYNAALSLSQIQQVEGYLAWKWGLQGNLPANHPYKTQIFSVSTLPPLFLATLPTPLAPSLAPFSFFSPLQISGCQLWLDAADRSRFVLSDSSVTTWRDKSTSSNNFTITSGTATYTANTVIIPSGAILTSGSSVTLSTNTYVFIVAQLAANNLSFSYLLGFTNITPGIYPGDYAIRYSSGILIGTQTSVGNTNDFANSNYYVNGTFNPSFTSSTYFSQHIISGASTSSGTTSVTLSSAFGNRFFVGNVYEVLFYNSVPTTAQRQQIEGYLAWKWGVVASLPSNHPYKNNPPGLNISPVPPLRQMSFRSFSPLSITGCQLWLDAADPSVFTYSSGTTISRWNDKSANSNYFSQGTVANQPVFMTTPGGYPAVYFSVNTKQLVSVNNSATTGNASRTFFTVMQAANSSNGMVKIGTGTHAGNTPPTAFGVDISPSVPVTPTIWSPYVYNTPDISWIATITSLTATYAFYDSSTGTLGGNYNFITVQTKTTTLNTTALPWYMGRRPDGSGAVDGYVCEIIHYNTSLSTAQRQQIEGYLAWKWGLQASLPSNHPFSKFPPPPS